MPDTPTSKWFNLILRFEGLLDVIHEMGATWIVVPDASEPTNLALHEDVLTKNGQLMIVPHVPEVHIAGQPASAITGLVTFDADFVNTRLDEVRAPCGTATPADGDRRSLLWLPNLSTLSVEPLRSGLSNGAAKYQQLRIVSASVRLDQGVLATEDFWRMQDDEYWKTTFDGKYASARALAKSIVMVATVAGGAVTIREKPFDGREETIELAPLADHVAVQVTISNHPIQTRKGRAT
jgi:hypothetical protein